MFAIAAMLDDVGLGIDGLNVGVAIWLLRRWKALSFSLDLALYDLVLVDPQIGLVAESLNAFVVHIVAIFILSWLWPFLLSVLIRICSIEGIADGTHCIRQSIHQRIVCFVSVVLQVLDQTNLGILVLQSRYILYALAILDLLVWACSSDCSRLQALHVQRCGFTHELILSEGISLSVS